MPLIWINIYSIHFMSGTVLGIADSEGTRSCSCYCNLQFSGDREDLKEGSGDVWTGMVRGSRYWHSSSSRGNEARNSILWIGRYNEGREMADKVHTKDPVLYAIL